MEFRAHELRLLHELRHDELKRKCLEETKWEILESGIALNVYSTEKDHNWRLSKDQFYQRGMSAGLSFLVRKKQIVC
jgi:hypothetical protein